MGRILGIEVVVRAASAAVQPVRRGGLQDFDAGSLQVAQPSSTVGASRLDTDALAFAERTHPFDHLSLWRHTY
jgi:hypothetical protein